MDRLQRVLGHEKYEKVQVEDGDTSQPEEEQHERHHRDKRSMSCARNIIAVINAIFLVLNLVALIKLYIPPKKLRNQELRDQSFFSPIFDRLEIPITTLKINASLADEDESIWRKPPSPEVDAAWSRISQLGYHTISTSDVVALGKDPTLTVKAPLSWNRGPEAHIVQVDVTHQIHCLNAIRKAMYPAHYPPARKLMLEVGHVEHCLHVLLQNIMCDASVDVMTYNWVETQRNPFPDMSVHKKCRDFEAVLGWHEKNLVPLTEKVVRPADGVREVPLPKKLREILEVNQIEGVGEDDTGSVLVSGGAVGGGR